MFKYFHAKRKIKCFTFYWRRRLPIDVLFQHHPVLCNFIWDCKPHHVIIFLLLVFICFVYYLLWFQNSCANLKELLWLFISLTNFSPYHLLNFFQQSLIILKYGSYMKSQEYLSIIMLEGVMILYPKGSYALKMFSSFLLANINYKSSK